jgi:ElaB/YqjD/DUF883 family membrane-anchored ribosome-binding protein
MAKRSVGGRGRSTQDVIGDFAEDMGRLLGQARNKAEGWLGQRQAIVKQLTQLRDEATSLLNQLGHQAVAAGRRGRRAASAAVTRLQKRGPGRPKGSGKKKRRTMSAAARAAISAAQKARWAKQKAGKK